MHDKAIFVVNTNSVMSEDTRGSLQYAASRWGADYVEVKKSDAPFAHQALKLKAFEICGDYEDLLVIDSDTIIRSDAPNIFAQAPAEYFCAVRNRQNHFPGTYKKPNYDIAKSQIEYLIELHGLQDKNIDIENMAQNFLSCKPCSSIRYSIWLFAIS
jgi:alpha-N-acetylglucosamine transferase